MSEGMPGWGEFQSAISQLESATGGSGGGGGGGGGSSPGGGIRAEDGSIVNPNFYGGSSRSPVTRIDPVDEAYQRAGLQEAGYSVTPGGDVFDTGSHPSQIRTDPIDERYMHEGLRRAGYTIDPSGLATRTGNIDV